MNQFAIGDTTRVKKTPDKIAPGISGTHEPLHHDKVPIQEDKIAKKCNM